ncbi:MAG TPA: adenine phosphoribosyltransferase [bacterium]|nr:adenine phosphoribosyltransferase [bacterium]HPO07463.1 adenine phosphoribosyltransferase [bacterium]
MDLKSVLRTVPGFPKEGITFIDVTTLVKDGKAFREAIRQLLEPFRSQKIDRVVGIESRGFIFGGAVALELGCGFVPVRKPGKLPAETYSESYELEYGTDTLEIHKDAVEAGQTVLVVDDLLATGGTAAAVLNMLKNFDCKVAGIAFVVELDFLNGRAKLGDIPVHSLVHYDSE